MVAKQLSIFLENKEGRLTEVTDIRPDVFRKALQQKSKEINTWVVGKLKSSIQIS